MKFLNGIITWGLAILILAVGVSFADEPKVDDELIAAQPWLIERPEEVVEVELPPVDNFWGYEYTPIVITWYGKYVRKFKHELEPYRSFGAQADSAEVSQQCEDKIDKLEKDLNKAVAVAKATKFAFVVTCLGKYIVKVVEEEEEEEK